MLVRLAAARPRWQVPIGGAPLGLLLLEDALGVFDGSPLQLTKHRPEMILDLPNLSVGPPALAALRPVPGDLNNQPFDFPGSAVCGLCSAMDTV